VIAVRPFLDPQHVVEGNIVPFSDALADKFDL
jgi:hypothetical protein